MPAFWASGSHVANDVPPLLATLHARRSVIELRLLPVLVAAPGMLDFIADAVVNR